MIFLQKCENLVVPRLHCSAIDSNDQYFSICKGSSDKNRLTVRLLSIRVLSRGTSPFLKIFRIPNNRLLISMISSDSIFPMSLLLTTFPISIKHDRTLESDCHITFSF